MLELIKREGLVDRNFACTHFSREVLEGVGVDSIDVQSRTLRDSSKATSNEELL